MIIKKISKEEFVQFASNHPLRSYHQSPEYATYMESKGYKHEFIALVDEYNTIHASSLILYKTDGSVINAEGKTYGTIIDEEKGDTSFGYDCIFFSDDLGKTFGEATFEEKNSVSHRYRALMDLKEKESL